MSFHATVSRTIALFLTIVIGACDDAKPTAQAAPSASAPAVAPPKVEEPAASASPSAAPAQHVVKRKDPASCPKDGPVVFEDTTLETVVRRQLQKPSGPIARTDL